MRDEQGNPEGSGDRPWVELQQASFRLGGREVFPRTCWRWRRGEQWAVLGPNGAGKSLFVQALQGLLPRVSGEVEYAFGHVNRPAGPQDLAPEEAMVEVSPRLQRELARQECSFYQSRWHSGVDEGQRTVADFLSQESVEQIVPFEVNAQRSDPRAFARARRAYLEWLGLEPLRQRKLAHLSHGEQRKTLLARALLRSPRLLILDDPYGGLDATAREHLRDAVRRWMAAGHALLVATSRIEEIPEGTTHVLWVHRQRILAQGPKETVLSLPLCRRLCGDASGRAEPPSPRLIQPTRSVAERTLPGWVVQMEGVTIRVGTKKILNDVSWGVRKGECWALFGPNGAGKSTLLSLLQGDHPQVYAQNIRLFGVCPTSTQSLWQTRARIGWLSPEMNFHYPPETSCMAVVCSGFFNSIGLFRACSPRQRASARRGLEALGLADSADRPFGGLSVGLQRLVLLARATVKRPRLLILDEPCQGLDAVHRHGLMSAVDRLVRHSGVSLIFVTHERHELPTCVTHALELRRGRVFSAGPLAASEGGPRPIFRRD